jgi:hypothetical protein
MKPKLEYASRGTYVIEVQTKLNALMPEAQPPLKVDGTYGKETVTRVKQFQKSRGLTPDGVVGAKTWAAIDGLPSAGQSSPGPATAPSANLKGIPVHTGTLLRCDLGTAHSVFIGTTGNATVADCRAYVNILPFGQCKSQSHPGHMDPAHFEDPLLDVSFNFKGVKTPPCTPTVVGCWDGHFNKKNGPIDPAQVIDKSARCSCYYGGSIRFK